MRELYTRDDGMTLTSYFHPRYLGTQSFNLTKYIIKTCLCELSDDTNNKLSNVNLLVDTLNSNGFTFSHYSNVTEFDNVFDTAYNSGESGLSTRDRIILRAIAWPGVSLSTGELQLTFTYTSDGVPDYTSSLISESGKTTREMLAYCFTILDKMFSVTETTQGTPWIPSTIDYINSTIPDKYSPKLDRTDTDPLGNTSAASIWFQKALLIGPAYLTWLAENKWRLDLTWRP